MSKGRLIASTPRATEESARDDAPSLRQRIVAAAFAAFRDKGYAATTTLEIATRARVSKRELYALVGNKQQLLIACISERAARLHAAAALPPLGDRKALAAVLTAFGAQLLRETSDPAVLAVFRLAIAEAIHAPEVARTLDSIGRDARRAALRRLMAGACGSGLLEGDSSKLADEFNSLLSGDLMISLLLGVVARPHPREVARRAGDAVSAFLRLHPQPSASSLRARGRRRMSRR